MSSRASSWVSTWSFSSVCWIDGALSNSFEDLVGGPAERLQEDGHVLAALAVDAHADGVLLVDVELEPGAAGRDDLGDEDVLVGGLVQLTAEVDAGRAHELGDHDALGAVDDEGAPLGHHGEVPHEDLLLLDLAGDLVDEGRLDEQRRGEGHVLVAALLLGELDLPELVLAEVELELLGEVLDGRDLLEDLLEAFVEEPSKESFWIATRSGSGRTSSSLAKLTRFANRDELVRQADPLPGRRQAAHDRAVDGTANEQSTRRCRHRQRALPRTAGSDEGTPLDPGGQPAGRGGSAGPAVAGQG